jgi:hypothetical protein
MTELQIVFGKHVLESLSIGMYSDPLTVYREYIQNSTDALDEAIRENIIDKETAKIQINIDIQDKTIKIRDNGIGVKAKDAYNVLLDVANSQKDYRTTRGFRGIGRLGGLGCSKRLIFITSSKGEDVKTIVTWDCDALIRLLGRDNKEAKTALEVMQKVTSISQEQEQEDEHYFEVCLDNVYPNFDELLDCTVVDKYLCTVAPIPFDSQMFSHTNTIKSKMHELGLEVEEYSIFLNEHKKNLFKKYKNSVNTGNQASNKKTDYVSRVDFFSDNNETGKLTYFGWYGITNFYGSINDDNLMGLRLRKGNILIGDRTTCNKFFKSEGERANFWFLGEVYIYDEDLIPNAKRDDFERNPAYARFLFSISKKADELNKKHRRLMSEYHSAVKSIEETISKVCEIEKEITSIGITSETRREKLIERHTELQKKLVDKTKEFDKVLTKPLLDKSYVDISEEIRNKAEEIKKKRSTLERIIIDADYATKLDLITSYSKEQRKIYQRIISVIDNYFESDKKTATELRSRIIEELNNN